MLTAFNRSLDKKRARLENNEKGFTLIELLVVVIIIGILAAIAIPVFLNQREAAWRGEIESDLKNAAIAAETYSVTNNGSYDGLTQVVLEDNGWEMSNDRSTIAVVETGTAYTLTMTHPDLTQSLAYVSDAGGLQDWTP